MEIRNEVALPARHQPVVLDTADGQQLVGQISVPVSSPPRATLLMLHPLPTHGGSTDSHLYRKAALRLPALADLAVVRINTRGTSSSVGTSTGDFDHAIGERYDVAALLEYAEFAHLPHPWVVGWSFGADLALMYGCDPAVEGVVLISPPLRYAQPHHLLTWAGSTLPVVALVPEYDGYLRPEQARERLAVISQAEVVEGPKAKHLWVGEKAVRFALGELVRAVVPHHYPPPTQWDEIL